MDRLSSVPAETLARIVGMVLPVHVGSQTNMCSRVGMASRRLLQAVQARLSDRRRAIRAQQLQSAGHTNQAIALYKSIFNDAGAAVNCAKLLHMQGKHAEASEWFQKAGALVCAAPAHPTHALCCHLCLLPLPLTVSIVASSPHSP